MLRFVPYRYQRELVSIFSGRSRNMGGRSQKGCFSQRELKAPGRVVSGRVEVGATPAADRSGSRANLGDPAEENADRADHLQELGFVEEGSNVVHSCPQIGI